MEDNLRGRKGREVTALEAIGTDEVELLRREVAALRASRERIVRADDADRRDLERALHDGVQQQLVGLAASLELATATADGEPAETPARLAAMRDELQRAIDAARTLAHRVHPPLLDAGGLGPALRETAAHLNVRVSIEVSPEPLVPVVAAAIHAACAEALEIVRSGGSVTITVRRDEGRTSFEVLLPSGIGDVPLPRSRDRIEALGGTLDVDGARIRGRLPSR
jgi:signal transduction histidine kinase